MRGGSSRQRTMRWFASTGTLTIVWKIVSIPPVIIVDPLRRTWSCIGGFKRDLEVGIAMHEGNPVYFIIFFLEPCQGQRHDFVAECIGERRNSTPAGAMPRSDRSKAKVTHRLDRFRGDLFCWPYEADALTSRQAWQ